MILQEGKVYTLTKKTEPKIYPCVVKTGTASIGSNTCYVLDILTTKKFRTAYYDPSTNKLFNSMFVELVDWVIEDKQSVPTTGLPCDCGGFTTYKSYAPEYHSTWCSSQKKG